jgi:hypothetical protein
VSRFASSYAYVVVAVVGDSTAWVKREAASYVAEYPKITELSETFLWFNAVSRDALS